MLLISFFSFSNVNAAQVEGCIDSGTSLKNYAKLGYNYVGATGKYYSIAAGALDNNQLNVEFCTDINESTEQSGTATVGFSIDFCTNLSIKDNNIVFSPKNGNYIDYLGWAGYNVYLTSADWSAATCYRAFVRLKMNYYNNVGTSVSTMFTQYSDTDSDFQFTNKDSWSGMLSFYDVIYYNEDDYNKALLSFKGDNASVETNDKLDDVTGAIGDTNDKLDDMLNTDADASVNPDDSKYDDYESAEGDLKDKVGQADLTNLSIGIDSKSSSWIWDTLTNFINANSIVFSMYIAILSIGVIKLALGR